MNTVYPLQPACPFGYKPGDIITHEVPEHLRQDIAELWKRREHLNQPHSNCARWDWYRQSLEIYEAFEKIENELRKLTEAPRASHVEYYAGWQFRCPNIHTLHAEYLARCEKK